jgi:hypothetical protein
MVKEVLLAVVEFESDLPLRETQVCVEDIRDIKDTAKGEVCSSCNNFC